MTSALDRLLAERVEKRGEVVVSAGDVMRWSEAHRETASRHWPDLTDDWVAPPVMVTSFIRPLEWRPDRQGPPGDRGSTLHERLKTALGYPLGIAAGYGLELHRPLTQGDRIDAVERIESVGDEEATRLGVGRRWVIENTCTLSGSGELVAVERFSMLGYDPDASRPSTGADPRPDSRTDPAGSVRDPVGDGLNQPEVGEGDRVEELDVTAVAIAMGASANRVWVAAHLDRDAAQAAGVRDVFMDTSTQVGLLSGVACRAAGPDGRPGRVTLRMRRPVCPGDRLRMDATVTAVDADQTGVRWASVDVRGRVGDAVHSTLTARVAISGPPGGPIDPWLLSGDAWRP